MVAKSILFRSAERLYRDLQIEGYRANTIAYAIAWLAKHSNHRINLTVIWELQRVGPFTDEAIKTVCRAAYKHLTEATGNVGEWSKNIECWKTFCLQEIVIDPAWEKEWADTPFIDLASEMDAVADQWEKVRRLFLEDSRTLGQLEKLTGLEWLATRRSDEARIHAAKSWRELKAREDGVTVTSEHCRYFFQCCPASGQCLTFSPKPSVRTSCRASARAETRTRSRSVKGSVLGIDN